MCVISEENTTLNSCFLGVLLISLESLDFVNVIFLDLKVYVSSSVLYF